MKEHKSKQMFKEKEKAILFSESQKEFFGQNFREDWCTSLVRHQQHLTDKDRPLEGALQHHLEEVVEGVHHTHSSLDQCQKHKSIIRVIKSPYLSTLQFLGGQYAPPQLAKVNQDKRLQINSEIKKM